MSGPKHPTWTVREVPALRGIVLFCDGAPMFAMAHLEPLTNEGAMELAANIAAHLTEDARISALRAVGPPRAGVFWAIDNAPESPEAPVRINLVGAEDFEASITFGPRIEDGLFLRALGDLVRLFHRLERGPEPEDPTHRRHQTARGRLPRRRPH